MGIPVEPISDLFPRDALDAARVNLSNALVYFLLPGAFDLLVRRRVET